MKEELQKEGMAQAKSNNFKSIEHRLSHSNYTHTFLELHMIHYSDKEWLPKTTAFVRIVDGLI